MDRKLWNKIGVYVVIPCISLMTVYTLLGKIPFRKLYNNNTCSFSLQPEPHCSGFSYTRTTFIPHNIMTTMWWNQIWNFWFPNNWNWEIKGNIAGCAAFCSCLCIENHNTWVHYSVSCFSNQTTTRVQTFHKNIDLLKSTSAIPSEINIPKTATITNQTGEWRQSKNKKVALLSKTAAKTQNVSHYNSAKGND